MCVQLKYVFMYTSFHNIIYMYIYIYIYITTAYEAQLVKATHNQ